MSSTLYAIITASWALPKACPEDISEGLACQTAVAYAPSHSTTCSSGNSYSHRWPAFRHLHVSFLIHIPECSLGDVRLFQRIELRQPICIFDAMPIAPRSSSSTACITASLYSRMHSLANSHQLTRNRIRKQKNHIRASIQASTMAAQNAKPTRVSQTQSPAHGAADEDSSMAVVGDDATTAADDDSTAAAVDDGAQTSGTNSTTASVQNGSGNLPRFRGPARVPIPVFEDDHSILIKQFNKRKGPLDELRFVQEKMAYACLRFPHLRPAGWRPDVSLLPKFAGMFDDLPEGTAVYDTRCSTDDLKSPSPEDDQASEYSSSA